VSRFVSAGCPQRALFPDRLSAVARDDDSGTAFAETALAIHAASSGPNHPWTKDSASVTAEALDVLGRTGEAKALRERYGLTPPENPQPS
jgi:hypothetical protein